VDIEEMAKAAEEDKEDLEEIIKVVEVVVDEEEEVTKHKAEDQGWIGNIMQGSIK